MMNDKYVEVVAVETEEVVKRLGPMSEWKATKVERGIGRNMNDEVFYTRIVGE